MRKLWILALLALASSGCASDDSQITPTTTGLKLNDLAPRGKVRPQPLPGSSLAAQERTDDAPTDTSSAP